MKRLIVLALVSCLLLCGCVIINTPPAEVATQPQPTAGAAAESTDKTQTSTEICTEPTQPSTESATESTGATQTPTEMSTEPTQPKEEKVTVYLLTKMTVFDSGSTEYYYDENYNIDSYKVYSIENEPMYEVFFENKDAHGMAGVIRARWPEGIGDEIRNLTYVEDGKLKEEQIDGGNYSGYQYAYDQKGNRTEKREYYDGVLQSAVYYEYADGVLKRAYCEDNAGNIVFECRIENGLIIEKIFYDSNSRYGYRYEYDEHNNLVQTTFYYDGEDFPGDQFVYTAVEVDAERAPYLQEQQKYLIFIT